KIDQTIKSECELLGAQVLVKAKKLPEARKKFERVLQGMKPDSPEAMRVKIYLIQCNPGKGGETEKDLRALIAKLSDKDPADRALKAMAYNTLGDTLMAAGKSRDAFWAYMFVDVEYNQDKGEHKKALQQLWKLFEEFKDDAKAKQYKERYQKAGG